MNDITFNVQFTMSKFNKESFLELCEIGLAFPDDDIDEYVLKNILITIPAVASGIDYQNIILKYIAMAIYKHESPLEETVVVSVKSTHIYALDLFHYRAITCAYELYGVSSHVDPYNIMLHFNYHFTEARAKRLLQIILNNPQWQTLLVPFVKYCERHSTKPTVYGLPPDNIFGDINDILSSLISKQSIAAVILHSQSNMHRYEFNLFIEKFRKTTIPSPAFYLEVEKYKNTSQTLLVNELLKNYKVDPDFDERCEEYLDAIESLTSKQYFSYNSLTVPKLIDFYLHCNKANKVVELLDGTTNKGIEYIEYIIKSNKLVETYLEAGHPICPVIVVMYSKTKEEAIKLLTTIEFSVSLLYSHSPTSYGTDDATSIVTQTLNIYIKRFETLIDLPLDWQPTKHIHKKHLPVFMGLMKKDANALELLMLIKSPHLLQFISEYPTPNNVNKYIQFEENLEELAKYMMVIGQRKHIVSQILHSTGIVFIPKDPNHPAHINKKKDEARQHLVARKLHLHTELRAYVASKIAT